MFKTWSTEETRILKINWSKSDKELCKLLPKRTLFAIFHKRKRLGLKKRNYRSQEPICVICNCKLIDENWHNCFKKTKHYICNKCSRKRQKEYYWKNPEKARQYQREYARNHILKIQGKVIILNKRKRPFSNQCELCKEKQQRIEYHHWNDRKPENGLWLCFDCHRLAERMDKFGLKIARKYFKLKNEIEESKNQKL